jgi:uroporphyrinogen decarboxylase
VLYAGKDVIEREVENVLSGFGSGSGHVFNLGHGIHQFVNPDHPKYLIDAVHNLGRKYHEPKFDDLDALNGL